MTDSDINHIERSFKWEREYNIKISNFRNNHIHIDYLGHPFFETNAGYLTILEETLNEC